jgi:molybdopterin-guanine dinucleotide biosynthesis protein A
MKPQGISAFIIAGGQSRRFREDKSLFRYRGKALIESVIETVRPVIDRIAIVSDSVDRFAYLGLPCHADIFHGQGPIGGIHSALVNAETERVFVFACDMPGLSAALICHMAAISQEYDVTIPVIAGEFEPLHAVYSKTCVGPIEKRIRDGARKITGFFKEVSVRTVPEEEIRKYADPSLVFKNINYRRDAAEQ